MFASPFLRREFVSSAGILPYRLLPNPTAIAQPLVLFLHGAGERGTDNEAQLRHLVAFFARPETRERFPCLALVPQCPMGRRWVECDWSAAHHAQPDTPSEPLALVLALLEQALADPLVDARRVYALGISMGGYGVWDIAARRPDLFAAAVPICGGGDETRADALRDLPVWAFHGARDGVVPVARSRNMVAALRAAGACVRYTEYAGTGHDCWNPAGREPDLLPWLFGKCRDSRKNAANSA